MSTFVSTAGLALALSLVAAAVELSVAPVSFGRAIIALRHAAAAGLMISALAVPVALVFQSIRGLLRRQRAPVPPGPTDAIVALAAIASLYAVRCTHQILPGSPMSALGLVATAAAVTAVAAIAWGLSIGLTSLTGGRAFGRSRRIVAAIGWTGAVAAVALATWTGAASRDDDRPNVLLISIDSVRADTFREHLATRASAPLRAFVAGALSFDRAYTTYTHSLPSHASMLTGLYPPEHGAITRTTDAGVIGSPVAAGVPRLAERFSAVGYETIGVMANHWLGPPYGLEQGFQTYVSHGRALVLDHFDWALTESASVAGFYKAWLVERLRASHWNTRSFVNWLERRNHARPFFAFLHYIDMHVPHDPSPSFRARYDRGPFSTLSGSDLSARLDRGEIADSEMSAARERIRDLELARLEEVLAQFAPVLTALDDGGWLSRTLVILTADHGDNLYEKDGSYGHSHAYETSGHVPLLIRGPGVEHGSSEHLASLVDLAPTISSFADLSGNTVTSGIDLLGDPSHLRTGDAWIYLQGTDARHQSWARAVAWADGTKIIRDATADQIFDLTRDPTETNDLSQKDPVLASRLRQRFEAVLAEMVPAEGVEPIQLEDLDEATKAGLRALGYID